MATAPGTRVMLKDKVQAVMDRHAMMAAIAAVRADRSGPAQGAKYEAAASIHRLIAGELAGLIGVDVGALLSHRRLQLDRAVQFGEVNLANADQLVLDTVPGWVRAG